MTRPHPAPQIPPFLASCLNRAIALSSSWRRYLWRHRLVVSLIAGLASLLSLLITPAQALDVQLQPSNPQLGDTIAVTVQAASATPTITFNQKTYPAFPVAANRYRALLPTSPLDSPGRKTIQVSDGTEVRNLAIGLRNRSFPTQRIWVRGGGSGGSEVEFDRVNAFKELVTPQKFWNGAFVRPNAGGVTSVYGVRRYYNGVFANDYYHKGVDYGGGQGSPILAPAAGRVVLVGRESQGFRLHGNTIGVDHGQGVSSIFIHLSRIDVQEGEMVQPGQVIGALGATGSATGPNLHWGLYVNGVSVDPAPWRDRGFE